MPAQLANNGYKLTHADRELLKRFVSKYATSNHRDIFTPRRLAGLVGAMRERLYLCQRAIVESDSKNISICTPRQVGKTTVIAEALIESAIKSRPNVYSLYVLDTRQHAKDLMWVPLQNELDLHKIKYKVNTTELMIYIEGAGTIKLYGADDERGAKKLRGYQYAICCVDEAQDIDDAVLAYLLDEVLDAGMQAYDSPLIIAGTPGPARAGYFYRSTMGKSGFEHHTWTQFDNPLYPRWTGKENWQELVKEWLAAKAKRLGGPNEPNFLREYMGQWAEEDSIYIFHPIPESALYDPSDDDQFGHLPAVLGIDLGFVDDAAWVVNCYDQVSQKARAIFEKSESGLSLSDIMSITRHVIEEYHPERVVVDPSSGGKNLVAEISKRWGIPCEDAQKKDKASFLRLGRNSLRRGESLVLRGGELAKQLDSVRWDKKYQREAEGQVCDRMDAWLYSWRHCMQYYHVEPEPVLTEAERMKQRALNKPRPEDENDMDFDWEEF